MTWSYNPWKRKKEVMRERKTFRLKFCLEFKALIRFWCMVVRFPKILDLSFDLKTPLSIYITSSEVFQTLSWVFEYLRENQKLSWEIEFLSRVIIKLDCVFVLITWLILSQSAALAKVSYHKAEHSEHTHERPENIMGYIKNNKKRGLMEPNLPPVLTSLIAILHYSSFPNR